jgi:carbon storage regulator CsrA
MLLLTRKQGESLIIEVDGMTEPIEIALVESGTQARIGVSAPAKCKIWRKELYQTILANRQAATRAATQSTRDLAKELLGALEQAAPENKKAAGAGSLKSE